MAITFACLSLINFWIFASFDIEAVLANWKDALWFQPLIMALWTLFIFSGRPLTNINDRHLILMMVAVSMFEAHVGYAMMHVTIDWYYVTVYVPTLFSFFSWYLISNRERISLVSYKVLMRIPPFKTWATHNITRLFITDLDSYVANIFLILAFSFLFLDTGEVLVAAYNNVPWYQGHLYDLIESKQIFDLYKVKIAIIDMIMMTLGLALIAHILCTHTGIDFCNMAREWLEQQKHKYHTLAWQKFVK
jgi:hypothetical protein